MTQQRDLDELYSNIGKAFGQLLEHMMGGASDAGSITANDMDPPNPPAVKQVDASAVGLGNSAPSVDPLSVPLPLTIERTDQASVAPVRDDDTAMPVPEPPVFRSDETAIPASPTLRTDESSAPPVPTDPASEMGVPEIPLRTNPVPPSDDAKRAPLDSGEVFSVWADAGDAGLRETMDVEERKRAREEELQRRHTSRVAQRREKAGLPPMESPELVMNERAAIEGDPYGLGESEDDIGNRRHHEQAMQAKRLEADQRILDLQHNFNQVAIDGFETIAKNLADDFAAIQHVMQFMTMERDPVGDIHL